MRERGGICHQILSPLGRPHTTDTYLLAGILRAKDSGEMGCDVRWEVCHRTSGLIVEVADDAGRISDGVDEMSGNHLVQVQGGAPAL